MSLAFLLTQAVNGLVYSTLLFLLASGLALTFGLMGVMNLAHGSFFMVGAFFALTILKFTGSFWLALVLAPIPVALLSVAIETGLLQRLYRRPLLDQVLLTFGISLVAVDAVKWIWGPNLQNIDEPDALSGSIELFGAFFPAYRVALIGLGLIVAVGLWLLLERTRIGAMVRAGVDDRATAMGIGLNVPLLFTSIFAGGGALAALAGVAAGPVLGVYPGMDVDVLIPAFIVIVIGGMKSMKGALVGSLLIGMADTFGKAYLPDLSMFLLYIVMIVVLLVRPTGLFGGSSLGSAN
jgi:branched-subunit amino acid ABC-type transport system permease component